MTREIKFRAWNFVDHRWSNPDWVGLSLAGELLAENGGGDYGYSYCTAPIEIKAKYVLMQYTNKKDKSGNEIYEGDFIREVEYPNGPAYEVRWNEQYAAFCPTWNGQKIGWEGEDFEVIGNIHENPELLK